MSTAPTESARRKRAGGVPASGERGSGSRAAILAATEAVLIAAGVEGMSIRKVSESCGLSAPTIYHHFGDKAGLVSALLEERFREIHALMASIPLDGDAALYLRETARAFVGFALANPGYYRLLSMPGLDPHTVPSAEASQELVKRALEQLASEGTLATDDIDAAYDTTWAMIHGLISLHLLRPDHPFSEKMIDLALDVIQGGLLRRAPQRAKAPKHAPPKPARKRKPT